jgi:hypothetical protein
MTRNRRLGTRLASGVAALALLGSLGCQTYMGGMTLPSPHYLKQRPSYLEPASQYPLPKELAQQQAAYAAANLSINGASTTADTAPPAPNMPK